VSVNSESSTRQKLAIGSIALPAAMGLSLHYAEAVGAYMAIAIGSALGGVARYWCSEISIQLVGSAFPWGTLLINILGSFVIGLFATLTGPDGRVIASQTARLFVMVGICGGYTTFSAFSLQTLNLVNNGEWLRAAANIGASVTLCLVAVWGGHTLAAGLNSFKSL
jgi:fluoride exporter